MIQGFQPAEWQTSDAYIKDSARGLAKQHAFHADANDYDSRRDSADPSACVLRDLEHSGPHFDDSPFADGTFRRQGSNRVQLPAAAIWSQEQNGALLSSSPESVEDNEEEDDSDSDERSPSPITPSSAIPTLIPAPYRNTPGLSCPALVEHFAQADDPIIRTTDSRGDPCLSLALPPSRASSSPETEYILSADLMAPRPPITTASSLGPKMLEEAPELGIDHIVKRGRTVRFHSRVRISSGIHHDPSLSRSSSISGSSSMSAPLRPCPEEPVRPIVAPPRPIPPTLSQILTTDPSAAARIIHKNMGSQRRNYYSNGPANRRRPTAAAALLSVSIHQRDASNEGRPLSPKQRKNGRAATSPTYVRANNGIPRSQIPSPSSYYQPINSPQSDLYNYEDEHQSQRYTKTEDDVIYGTWPGRLLNHRWWWRKTENVLCCFSQ